MYVYVHVYVCNEIIGLAQGRKLWHRANRWPSGEQTDLKIAILPLNPTQNIVLQKNMLRIKYDNNAGFHREKAYMLMIVCSKQSVG